MVALAGLLVAVLAEPGLAGAQPRTDRAVTLAAATTSVPGGRFSDDGVIAFGDAPALPPTGSLPSPAVGIAAADKGVWVAAGDGSILAYGGAASYGSLAGAKLTSPVVGIASAPDAAGYWLVGLNGAVFGFGSARVLGSVAAGRLNAPIVALAGTPDGAGYWEVAADGGIFAFGDARFLGSMGGVHLVSPVVGMAVSADGRGYWEVAADGGVFAFGDAPYYGSLGGIKLPAPILAVATTPDRRGYWLAGADGAVDTFGDARFHGANAGEVPTPPIAGLAATYDGGGYWLLDPETIPTTFAAALSSQPGAAIVSAARTQLGGNPRSGRYCNLYGPCEEWCALFATWAWQQAGVPIPRYPFVGDIYVWARAHTATLPPNTTPAVGDLVLYGTGPASVATSVHTAIVAEVWPDGSIVTIDGDAGPGPSGSTNVVMNGPFLPSQSQAYNGFPIYAYAVP